MVMLFSSIPCSFNQYASVPATRRNGKPEEKPNRKSVHAAGCVKACHTEGLRTFSAAVVLTSDVVVDGIRCVVGEAWIARDTARFQFLRQARRGDLIVN